MLCYGCAVCFFFLCIDDTLLFPDSLLYMLSSYNSSDLIIVGEISETSYQVGKHRYIPFGGAGVKNTTNKQIREKIKHRDESFIVSCLLF